MKKIKRIEEYADVLLNTVLFSGVTLTELDSMLICLDAQVKSVKKGKIILFPGEKPEYFGMVLRGQIHITRDDYNGNRSIIAAVSPGEIFAEALCCADVPESPIAVTAAVNSSFLILKFTRIVQSCTNACTFHKKLIENLLRLIANKMLVVQSRMQIVESKSVRTKILMYLESFIPKQGKTITIPFNREEMANFLCVERSALSHELMRMKKDGLLEYRKNEFLLK